jgi:hypothetical protein
MAVWFLCYKEGGREEVEKEEREMRIEGGAGRE